MTPDLGLAHLAGRCAHGFAPQQHPLLCQCADAERGKVQGIAASNAKATDEQKRQIDLVIRRVAALGGEFSANDVRPQLAPVLAPFMGARFSALAKAGLIRHVGYTPSSKGNTHAHDIKTWRAAKA